jgi:hypothetical protein
MIYIFTALYCEAHIFIQKYNLIKNQEITWFQEFYNKTTGIRLAVTGVGEIAAAAVVSSICSLYKPAPNDMLLNIGLCAHTVQNNGIFLSNKIIEQVTGKTFYPDILYRHNFLEGTIITGMQLLNNENYNNNYNNIAPMYDMEAAAIYQVGIHFFGPHQMFFLKIVSDKGSAKEVSKEHAAHIMEQYQDCIFDFIKQLFDIIQKSSYYKIQISKEDERIIETFCTDLHCSKAMRDSLKQYIRYLMLSNTDYISIIQNMYKEHLLPCKDKKEGKLRFEEFKKRLF